MKKIFLLVAFALTVSVASAWHKNCNAGVVALAVKHLTPEAKSVADKYLGSTPLSARRRLTLQRRSTTSTSTKTSSH